MIAFSNTFQTSEPDPVIPEGVSIDPNGQFPNHTIELIPKDKFKQITPDKKLIDIKEYNKLQTIKNSYNNPLFDEARRNTNSFENIGRSFFINRAGVKLANIDAVFNILRNDGGLIAQQTVSGPQFFTYCDVAGAPGAFTQYILFRRFNSTGLGISLRGGLDWHKKIVQMEQFEIYNGEDGSGDLLTQSSNFIDRVKWKFKDKVDLIVADGGADVSKNFEYQEQLSVPLVVSECYIGVTSVKPGGSFVLKIFDTVTTVMSHLLYLLGLSFEKVVIFKPISSRPANSERYVICTKLRRQGADMTAALLKKVWKQQGTEYIPTSLIDKVDSMFIDYLKQTNRISLKVQLQSGTQIVQYIRDKSKRRVPEETKEYNLYKALIVWNLPDNQDRIGKFLVT